MGGFGSGRWGWHDKKYTTDTSLGFGLSDLKESLNKIAEGQSIHMTGSLQWTRAKQVVGGISYRIVPRNGWPVVYLIYSTKRRDGTTIDSNYPVEVTVTTPNYGGRHWWWVCPLVKNNRPCGRRVGKLYCPGNAIYFGCRHCYELTYTSCQESHQYDSMFADLAASMSDRYPGMTGRAVKELLDGRYKGRW